MSETFFRVCCRNFQVSQSVATKTATAVTVSTIGAVAAFFFLRLTYRNIGAVGDRVDLSNW